MNNVVLLGRMTSDADLKFSAGTGDAVCRFTLAVNRAFKKDETDFIKCVAFGKTAETITQYVTKGQQICINGNIRTGSYDKEGTKVYTTDIVVQGFTFVATGGNKTGDANYNKDFEPVADGDMPF